MDIYRHSANPSTEKFTGLMQLGHCALGVAAMALPVPGNPPV
jgi:hypothetical protein